MPDNGDGNVDQQDLFWYDQFARGLHCPSDGPYNEFQRLDGNDNGLIDGGDYTYISNVFLGLLPKVPAKGPTAKPANLCFGVPTETNEGDIDQLRAPVFLEGLADAKLTGVFDVPAPSLTAVSTMGAPGSDVLVTIRLDARGDERSTSTTIQWDPSMLSLDGTSGFNVNPDVTPGPDAVPGQLVGVNANDVASGRLGLLIDFTGGYGGGPISAGSRQIATLRFHISDQAPTGTIAGIWFGDSVVPQQTVDTKGRLADGLRYNNGVISIVRPGRRPITPIRKLPQ